MFDIKYNQKGGEILMAQSDKFGALLRDIVGNDGVRKVAAKIGVSSGYMSSILDGYVPNTDKIAAIVSAYNLDEQTTKMLYDSAKELREEIDELELIHIACAAAGLSTSRRLAILNAFRSARQDQESEQTAA